MQHYFSKKMTLLWRSRDAFMALLIFFM